MVPLNFWYKPLAGTTETFVPGNGWYKCVIGTKKQLVPNKPHLIALQNQNYWLYDITCKLQSCPAEVDSLGQHPSSSSMAIWPVEFYRPWKYLGRRKAGSVRPVEFYQPWKYLGRRKGGFGETIEFYQPWKYLGRRKAGSVWPVDFY